jgi:hypothetical protein
MDRSKRIRINDFLARKETPVITLSFPPSSGHRTPGGMAAWRRADGDYSANSAHGRT